MILRHVGITVSDMDRSLGFYRDLLGLEICREMDEYGDYIDNFSGLKDVRVRTVKMKFEPFNDIMLELLCYSSHPESPDTNLNNSITQIGCSHFAVTVKDLDSLYEKLMQNDVHMMCEPQTSPDGKAKLTFCRDPDGTLIELVQML